MNSTKHILDEALRRGQQLKAELPELSAGLLSASQAATLLGIAPQTLEARTSLIALATDAGTGYPAFQFEGAIMIDGVARDRAGDPSR